MRKEQTLHLGMNIQEAIESKKHILYTEMHLVEILKNLENYKNLRKTELIKKEHLKNELKKIIGKLNIVLREIPKIKTDTKIQLKKEKVEKKLKEKKDSKSKNKIESELKEIRKQIESLEKKY